MSPSMFLTASASAWPASRSASACTEPVLATRDAATPSYSFAHPTDDDTPALTVNLMLSLLSLNLISGTVRLRITGASLRTRAPRTASSRDSDSTSRFDHACRFVRSPDRRLLAVRMSCSPVSFSAFTTRSETADKDSESCPPTGGGVFGMTA